MVFTKPYFIAEIGSNFDGSLSRATELIELAKKSGADAAKFQHYTAKSLVSDLGFSSLNLNTHQSKWKESVYKTYDKASLPVSWTHELAKVCENNNIDFLTSPYSKSLLDETFAYMPFIKIGSGDISELDFIDHCSKKNKPILLATGASTLEDVKRAVSIINNRVPVVLMQCNTNYENNSSHRSFQNISVISTFKKEFPNVQLGLSCHHPGHLTVLAAISLGGLVIEKHFTDDNNRKGPDHSFALNPASFKVMVNDSLKLFEMLGDGIKKVEENEKSTAFVQRRAIAAKINLSPGHMISSNDITYLRPFLPNSYHPFEKSLLIGRKISSFVKAGSIILKSDLL